MVDADGSAARRVADAYAACARLARRHYENFPVASLLLPAKMRPHVTAVYAFARTADDFADEGQRTDAERLRLLDWWLEVLRRTAAAAGAGPGRPGARPEWPAADFQGAQAVGEAGVIFTALGETMRSRTLPIGPFEDLLSAFRQDVTVHRYAGWDDLLDYCRRSASPVGRLVLRIAGRADAALDEASDALCTALQLTNFWQDLARDWQKGRLYVPLSDLDWHGARVEVLDEGPLTPAWRAVMAEMVARTRVLFDRGRPVCDLAGSRLGFELRLTWLGGVAVLDRVGSSGFDPFARRPALGGLDWGRLLAGAVLWRKKATD